MSEDLPALKQRIWSASKQNLQTVTIFAASVGVMLPIETEEDATKVLQEIHRRRENPIDQSMKIYKHVPAPQIETVEHEWKARYQAAHRQHYEREFPSVVKDGHYTGPVIPPVYTANGLTAFIVNFLNWSLHNAVRINVSGRLINKLTKEPSGKIFLDKKMIKSSTRKGQADIRSTILGKSVQWEIKVGKDRPSEKQIEEQRRERRAGGEYFFVHDPNEFFTLYDSLLYGQ